MKKREPVKRKENVIFFPGLEKRLTDKGLESLEKKKYNEAIIHLEEARELDPDNDHILIGLVLAYFEAGAYKKAKVLANEMLLKGIGDYFQLVDLYLTVLIQLHEYQEIVSTIEALFEEKEIPPEKQDHFLTILQFSQRMADNRKVTSSELEPEPEERVVKELKLLEKNSLNEQLLLISSLAEKNIRPFIPEIAEYLLTDEGHPFLKTMLLTLLKEQEIDKDFNLRKWNREEVVNPLELPEVRVHPRLNKVRVLLEHHLESNNPVLFEHSLGMLERTFFISYPFQLEPENNAAWAAAFHLLAHNYLGMEADSAEISREYDVSASEIEQAMAQIEELEKISYPNI